MSNTYNMNFNDGFYPGQYNQEQEQQYNAYYQQQQQQQQQQQPQQYQQPAQNSQKQSPFLDPSYFNASSSQQSFYNPSEYNYFQPEQTANKITNNNPYGTDEQDLPLLEELGINFEHIYRKTICVLNPLSKPHQTIIHDTDLAGPLVFCVAYGFSLLLLGKIQFGYVYGITALGCLCMFCLLNLMSDNGVTAICIASILGYCLLPMVILSFLSSVVLLKSFYGFVLSILFILWCSVSASKLFVYALNMTNQQILVLYPCSLLYGIFGLLNIF